MNSLFLIASTLVIYFFGYRYFARYLHRKVFRLPVAVKNPAAPDTSIVKQIQNASSMRHEMLGFHFAAITGLTVVSGASVAIFWGWVPALIWVFVGSIVMGAVHDFGALIISMRNQGKSISEYTAKYVNNRTKIFFFLIVFLELWIVIAIFGLVIAVVFAMYPTSVLPVWLEIPIAVYLGYLIYKKGANVMGWSIVAVAIMYVTVIIGAYVPIKMPTIAGIPATGVWTIIL
ncbi:MAG: carbon starvation CstA family protein, partial [Acidiferrobacterales bacterium]|nr:carbon starvation CstA family protein [Acidiferrobacterales bacterium]